MKSAEKHVELPRSVTIERLEDSLLGNRYTRRVAALSLGRDVLIRALSEGEVDDADREAAAYIAERFGADIATVRAADPVAVAHARARALIRRAVYEADVEESRGPVLLCTGDDLRKMPPEAVSELGRHVNDVGRHVHWLADVDSAAQLTAAVSALAAHRGGLDALRIQHAQRLCAFFGLPRAMDATDSQVLFLARLAAGSPEN